MTRRKKTVDVDCSSGFSYDSRGCLTLDMTRGIASVSYNHLDLPVAVTLSNGNSALFTYSGEGEKLRAQYTVTDMSLYGGGMLPPAAALVTTRLDYRGGRVYVDGSLAYAPVPGGYCTVIADTLAAHLTVRDYRGDVRSVIAEDGSVEEWTDYYPYGMAFYNPSASVQPWKHSSKEHESRLGLHWLDFGARRLDFAKGQWTTVDPQADKSPWQSPYAYCGADPVNYIDPDGREKLILFQPHVKDNDILIQGAKKFKDDDAIHIFAHGSAAGISPYVDLYKSGKESKSMVHDVISFKQLLNKSQIWRNRKKGEHVTIVLHGCMTGKGENSFAEIVSSALTDVTIIAPDNILYIDEDGEIGVYYPQKDLPEKANNLNDKKEGMTQSNKKGSWRVFDNGKVTQSFNGDWTPKATTNWLDDILYRQQTK